MDVKNRVVAFVDGFNLYHAIDELDLHPSSRKHTNSKHHLKWLNLWSLSQALIHPAKDSLAGVYYFSAFAGWINPGAQSRHRAYVNALKATGVQAILGTFKEKQRTCPSCHHRWSGHEEKESDVNLAIQLVKLAHENAFDKALIFTADTDLAPAIRAVKSAFPHKEIFVAIPSHRLMNANALTSAANGKIRLKETHFSNNAFGSAVALPSGGQVVRPDKYCPPATPV